MDELRIKNSFLKGIISKIVTKKIKKALECEMDIALDGIEITVDENETVNVKLAVNGKIQKKDLEKLIWDHLK